MFQVWMLILASLVVVALAMAAVSAAEGFIFNYTTNNNLRNATIWTLQALTQESKFVLKKHLHNTSFSS